MMMCLKDVLLYVLLLPIPSASPLFLILYTLAVLLAIRPCGYCVVLFSVLFLTTSPSSPFVSTTHKNILPINTDRPLTSPVPERTWLTWNDGRWWDPGLIAYRQMSEMYKSADEEVLEYINSTVKANLQAKASEPAQQTQRSGIFGLLRKIRKAPIPALSQSSPSQSSSVIDKDTKANENEVELPPGFLYLPNNYLDLRWKGVGFILDLGFSRSEEGMIWELDNTKRAIRSRIEEKKKWADKKLASMQEEAKKAKNAWKGWTGSFLGNW